MKDSMMTSCSSVICALGVVFLTGCGIIPTYVPPGYESEASVPAAPAPVAVAPASALPAAQTPESAPNPASSLPPASGLPAPAVRVTGIPGDQVTIDTIHLGDKLIITFSDTVTPVPPFEATVREDGMITLIYNKKIKA